MFYLRLLLIHVIVGRDIVRVYSSRAKQCIVAPTYTTSHRNKNING